MLKLPKVKLSQDFNRETYERCCILISMMESKLRNNKSMLVVNCENSGDHITDFFLDTLPCNVRKDAYTSYPCVIVNYEHQNKY